MKTTNFLLATVFCFLTIGINAQWEWQNPLPQGKSITGIHFVDENNGWAVGGTTILHTMDGGLTWEIQYNGCEYGMNDIYFTDLLNGWAVGVFFNILHTSDGGVTWYQQILWPGPRALNSVWFADSLNGWAVGGVWGGSQVVRTTDGGNTWVYQSLGSGAGKDLCFVSPNEGWIVRGNSILHTTDGWDTWSVQSSNTSNDLESICFIDASHGWAAGINGTILMTSNGGELWEPSLDTALTGINFRDVSFISATTGWTGGYYDNDTQNGIILKTTDGGVSWVKQISDPEIKPIYCFSFDNESGGYAAGAYGEMLKAVNGGDDWNRIYSCITTASLKDVFFIDDYTGWAAGGWYQENSHSPEIYFTSDGGVTWTAQEVTLMENHYLYKVFFADAQHGWALGRENYSTSMKVICTTNGGAQWELQSMDETGADIYFISKLVGWRVGENGAIKKTLDGGWNWLDQPSGTSANLTSVFFINEVTGWITGDSVILHTSDGGQNWLEQSSGIFNWSDIIFVDELHGWVVGPGWGYGGGKMMRTLDGGENWEDLNIDWPGFHELVFLDTENGWGRSRTDPGGGIGLPVISNIYKTTDGGLTWELQSIPELIHGGICFTDLYHGWAVSINGTILHFNDSTMTGFTENKIQNQKSKINVYPNPTQGIFYLQLANYNLKSVSCSIYDIHGREVASILDEKLPTGEHIVPFNASHLPPGLYFLRLQAGNEVRTGKVIKY